jgi:hypothetical protein
MNKKTVKFQFTNQLKYTFIILFLVIIIFFLSKLFKSNSIITGYVYSVTNPDIPLTNVLVNIDDKHTITNNELTGGYILQNIKKGEHKLKFSKQGYEDEIKIIEVKSGQEIKLNIYLKPKQEIEKIASKSILTANIGGNTVSIIDYNSRKVLYSLESGLKPYDIKYFPDRIAFVSNFGENTISLINLKKYELERKIQFDSNSQITKLEKDNYNLFLYALLLGQSKIVVVNAKDFKINSEIKSESTIVDFLIDKSSSDIIILTDKSLDFYGSSGNLIKSIYIEQSNRSVLRQVIQYSYNEFIILTSENTLKINSLTGEITILPITNITTGVFNNNSNLFYALKENKLIVYDYPSFEIKKEIELTLPRPDKIKLSPYSPEIFIYSSISNFIQVYDINTNSLESNINGYVTINSIDFIY